MKFITSKFERGRGGEDNVSFDAYFTVVCFSAQYLKSSEGLSKRTWITQRNSVPQKSVILHLFRINLKSSEGLSKRTSGSRSEKCLRNLRYCAYSELLDFIQHGIRIYNRGQCKDYCKKYTKFYCVKMHLLQTAFQHYMPQLWILDKRKSKILLSSTSKDCFPLRLCSMSTL